MQAPTRRRWENEGEDRCEPDDQPIARQGKDVGEPSGGHRHQQHRHAKIVDQCRTHALSVAQPVSSRRCGERSDDRRLDIVRSGSLWSRIGARTLRMTCFYSLEYRQIDS